MRILALTTLLLLSVNGAVLAHPNPVTAMRAKSLANKAAKALKQDSHVLYAICWAESRLSEFVLDAGAIGRDIPGRQERALGICQILPSTWEKLECVGDIWSPEAHFPCAARVIADIHEWCGKEPWKVIRAYHIGKCPKVKTDNGHVEVALQALAQARLNAAFNQSRSFNDGAALVTFWPPPVSRKELKIDGLRVWQP